MVFVGIIQIRLFLKSTELGKTRKAGAFEVKTEIEAFNAYKVAKETFIKEQAEKWKDEIDDRAYNALMNYDEY